MDMASARKDSEIRIVCTEDKCNVCTDLSVYTFYHHTLDRLPPNYKPYQKEYQCACGLFFPDLMEAGYHSADMRLKKDRRNHKIDRNDAVDISQHIPEIEKMALKFRHNLKRQGEIVIKDLTRGKENGHRRPPAPTPNRIRSASLAPSSRSNSISPGEHVQVNRRSRNEYVAPESAPTAPRKTPGSAASRGDCSAPAAKKDAPFKLKPSWARKYEDQARNSKQRQQPKTTTAQTFSDHPESGSERQSRRRSRSGSSEREERHRSPAAIPNRDTDSEDDAEQDAIVEEPRRTTRSMSGAGSRNAVQNPPHQAHQQPRQQAEVEGRDLQSASTRTADAVENPRSRIHFFNGLPLRSQHELPGGHPIYEYAKSTWEEFIGQPWSMVPSDQEEQPVDRHGTGYDWEDSNTRQQPRSSDLDGHGGGQDGASSVGIASVIAPLQNSTGHGSASAEVDPYGDRKRGRSETRRTTGSTVTAPSNSQRTQQTRQDRQPSEPPRKRGRPRKAPAVEEDGRQPSGVYNPADFPLRDHEGVYTRTRSRSRARSMVREPTPPNYDDSRQFDWEKDLEKIDRRYGRTRSSGRK